MIPWNKGKKLKPLSEDHKKRISIKLTGLKRGKEFSEKISKIVKGRKLKNTTKGEKHWNWKGGITPINTTLRKSEEYRLWRISVFIRDGRKCVWCGSEKDIQADHIKPFAFYPELRFAIDNGRTLCKKCHITTDTYKRPKNSFSGERKLYSPE